MSLAFLETFILSFIHHRHVPSLKVILHIQSHLYNPKIVSQPFANNICKSSNPRPSITGLYVLKTPFIPYSFKNFKYIAPPETPLWPLSHSIQYSREKEHFWTIKPLPIACYQNNYSVHCCLHLRKKMRWMLPKVQR